MTTDDLIFYDIECFPQDSLVVMKDYNHKLVGKFWNNPERKTIEDPSGFEGLQDVITGKILAGYNNHYYDDKMLWAMNRQSCMQDYLKKRNDSLIRDGNDDGFRIENDTLDVMQQIDVSRPSLKQIEGNMGISIEETEVDFNLDRHLTAEEKALTEKYCEHDVDTTIDVYKLRETDYFTVKDYVIEMLLDSGYRIRKDKDWSDELWRQKTKSQVMRWNTTSIIGFLLGSNSFKWQKLGTPLAEPLEMWTAVWRNIKNIPEDVWQLWGTANDEDLPKGKGINKNIYGCEFTFGFGGLHGVNKTKKRFTLVKLLDVASMYPSILINLQALGASTERYSEIKAERLKIKHIDKLKSNALKLILNSTYGLLKNEYSPLYNPKASSTVCIYGQLVAFDLCTRLHEAGYELVNINTDGVAFEYNGDDTYKDIWHQWEQDYHLELECDDFDRWIQKDVNNYIATSGNHIKTKGGEVGKYNTEKLFSNNSARIINIILVKLLLNPDESPFNLLKQYRDDPTFWDPKLWMYILKGGSTYLGTYDKLTGLKQNNVNRVYAVKERYKNIDLYKKRMDGGMVKFPDAPENMYLWNDDVSKIDHLKFREMIDLNHYLTIINKKWKEWE